MAIKKSQNSTLKKLEPLLYIGGFILCFISIGNIINIIFSFFSSLSIFEIIAVFIGISNTIAIILFTGCTLVSTAFIIYFLHKKILQQIQTGDKEETISLLKKMNSILIWVSSVTLLTLILFIAGILFPILNAILSISSVLLMFFLIKEIIDYCKEKEKIAIMNFSEFKKDDLTSKQDSPLKSTSGNQPENTAPQNDHAPNTNSNFPLIC